MHFSEVDSSVIAEPGNFSLASTLVRGDLADTRSAILDDAPTTLEERDRLWAKLREREAELPENAGGEEEQIKAAIEQSSGQLIDSAKRVKKL